jgi:hypothetical protein
MRHVVLSEPHDVALATKSGVKGWEFVMLESHIEKR